MNASLSVFVLLRRHLIFIRILLSVRRKVLEKKMSLTVDVLLNVYYLCSILCLPTLYIAHTPSFLILAEEMSSVRDASFSLVSFICQRRKTVMELTNSQLHDSFPPLTYWLVWRRVRNSFWRLNLFIHLNNGKYL